jgi:hypothetical protein
LNKEEVTDAYYQEVFRNRQINGKKLQILDLSDVCDLLPKFNLNQRLVLYKPIQDLIQFRHDLKADTLHTLLTNTSNKLLLLLKLLDDEKRSNHKREFIKATSCFVSITYRKLINWMIRLPFTRLKQCELFRDELNSKMKLFLKIFRSRNKLLNGDEEIKLLVRNCTYFKSTFKNLLDLLILKLNEMKSCVVQMIDYCEFNCNKDNSKISVAFNYCSLEKVVLKRRTPNQEIGLSFISLVDGIYTVGEINRSVTIKHNFEAFSKKLLFYFIQFF